MNCINCNLITTYPAQLSCKHNLCIQCIELLKDSEYDTFNQLKTKIKCPLQACSCVTLTFDIQNLVQTTQNNLENKDKFTRNEENILSKITSLSISKSSEYQSIVDINQRGHNSKKIMLVQQYPKEIAINIEPFIEKNDLQMNYNKNIQNLNSYNIDNEKTIGKNQFHDSQDQIIKIIQQNQQQQQQQYPQFIETSKTKINRIDGQEIQNRITQLKLQQQIIQQQQHQLQQHQNNSGFLNQEQFQHYHKETSQYDNLYQKENIQKQTKIQNIPPLENNQQVQNIFSDKDFKIHYLEKNISDQIESSQKDQQEFHYFNNIDWNLFPILKKLNVDCQQQQPLKCLKHNDFISLYCSKDKQLLCVQCLFNDNDHVQHAICPYKETLTSIINDTDNFKIILNSQTIKISESIEKCKENKQFINSTFQKIKTDLSNRFQLIIEEINKKYFEFSHILNEIYTKSIQTYDNMENDFYLLNQNLKEVINCSNTTANSINNITIVKQQQDQDQHQLVYNHLILKSLVENTQNFRNDVKIITHSELQVFNCNQITELEKKIQMLDLINQDYQKQQINTIYYNNRSLKENNIKQNKSSPKKQSQECLTPSKQLINSYINNTLMQNSSQNKKNNNNNNSKEAFDQVYHLKVKRENSSDKNSKIRKFSLVHSSNGKKIINNTPKSIGKQNQINVSYSEKAQKIRSLRNSDIQKQQQISSSQQRLLKTPEKFIQK